MRRFELTDEQWEKIKHLLPGKEGDSGRTAKDNRLFLDAVLWTARTSAQWRVYLLALATGTASINGSIDGPRRVVGSRFLNRCKILIWNGC